MKNKTTKMILISGEDYAACTWEQLDKSKQIEIASSLQCHKGSFDYEEDGEYFEATLLEIECKKKNIILIRDFYRDHQIIDCETTKHQNLYFLDDYKKRKIIRVLGGTK